ncbi:hypothetical protein DL96DRAFT_1702985 [Flagelloscypha sp. PMI_526]|nr:hypothetical protein DL96DRAFT_1702985 [Flagelloscypha sp. PMI_526]
MSRRGQSNLHSSPFMINGSSFIAFAKHKCRYHCACAEFATREQLWGHYQAVHAFCEDCKVPFKNGHGLGQHRRQAQKHWNEGIPPNQKYQELIDSIDDLTISGEQFNERRTCRLCVPPKSFLDPNQLDQHQIIHHPRTIPCPLCPRDFPSYSALVLHLEGASNCGFNNFGRAFEGIEANPRPSRFYKRFQHDIVGYQCPTCSFGSDRLSSILQHVEATGCSRDEMMVGMYNFLNRLHNHAVNNGLVYWT